MKIATMVAVLGTILLSTGCSTNVTRFSSVKATPTTTKTSLTEALSCASKALKKHNSDTAYAIFVRDLVDGTIRARSSSDGPLSDSGKIQLKNRLVSLIPSEDVLVIDEYPLIFKGNNKGIIGLDRFGIPPAKDKKVYKSGLLGLINKTRASRGQPEAKKLTFIVIDGAFTRIDSTAFGNSGYGLDLGNDGTASGDIDYGTSKSKKVISLDVNLVKPDLNILAISESLDLEFSSSTKKFGIKTSVGEGDLGLSLSSNEIESVHSAQQTLVDATALWVVGKLYSKAKTLECMPSNEQAK